MNKKLLICKTNNDQLVFIRILRRHRITLTSLRYMQNINRQKTGTGEFLLQGRPMVQTSLYQGIKSLRINTHCNLNYCFTAFRYKIISDEYNVQVLADTVVFQLMF